MLYSLIFGWRSFLHRAMYNVMVCYGRRTLALEIMFCLHNVVNVLGETWHSCSPSKFQLFMLYFLVDIYDHVTFRFAECLLLCL